jgi:uncharacterized protein (DUF488 family)
MSNEIFTIGHSTHTAQELIDIIKAFHITALIDVRTIPKSRYNPDFNKDVFPSALSEIGIKYFQFETLGGLRHPHKDSANQGWRNKSFRGYADYMQTQDFENALNELISLAVKETIVIMCAEAVPWRCHRSLIADALTIRGITVNHIMSSTKSNKHKITSFARVKGKEITYPSLPL